MSLIVLSKAERVSPYCWSRIIAGAFFSGWCGSTIRTILVPSGPERYQCCWTFWVDTIKRHLAPSLFTTANHLLSHGTYALIVTVSHIFFLIFSYSHFWCQGPISKAVPVSAVGCHSLPWSLTCFEPDLDPQELVTKWCIWCAGIRQCCPWNQTYTALQG